MTKFSGGSLSASNWREPPSRMVWIPPVIEVLRIDETETRLGAGHDGSFGQPPDCTRS